MHDFRDGASYCGTPCPRCGSLMRLDDSCVGIGNWRFLSWEQLDEYRARLLSKLPLEPEDVIKTEVVP